MQQHSLSAADRDRVALLNVLIAEAIAQRNQRVAMFRDLMASLGEPPTTHLSSYEKPKGFGDGPWHGIATVRRIGELTAEVVALEDRIGDLARQKLRLLDDVDFSGGDGLRARIAAAAEALGPSRAEEGR